MVLFGRTKRGVPLIVGNSGLPTVNTLYESAPTSITATCTIEGGGVKATDKPDAAREGELADTPSGVILTGSPVAIPPISSTPKTAGALPAGNSAEKAIKSSASDTLGDRLKV